MNLTIFRLCARDERNETISRLDPPDLRLYYISYMWLLLLLLFPCSVHFVFIFGPCWTPLDPVYKYQHCSFNIPGGHQRVQFGCLWYLGNPLVVPVGRSCYSYYQMHDLLRFQIQLDPMHISIPIRRQSHKSVKRVSMAIRFVASETITYLNMIKITPVEQNVWWVWCIWVARGWDPPGLGLARRAAGVATQGILIERQVPVVQG